MTVPSLWRRLVPFPWLPLVVLLAGLVGTGAYVAQLLDTVRRDDALQFDADADRRVRAISAELEKYIALLRGGAGLFAAGGEVDRAAFRRYVDRLAVQEGYPGLQGIGFCRRLLTGEVDTFVGRQRADGLPSYSIWPADPRAEYYPIVFIEPLDRRNRAALGYDMFTERVRRVAMERARDTASPAASGRVTLVQEIDDYKQPGFLIYVPIYEGGVVPVAVEDRRRRLAGFVYSPLRAGDFVSHVRAAFDPAGPGFEIFHSAEASDATLLYGSGEPPPDPRFTTVRRMDVAGSVWTFRFYAAPTHVFHPERFPWVTFAGGAMLSLLLAGLVHAQARRRVTEERASRATRELGEAEGRHAQRLAGILESITDAFYALDREWRFTYVNARALEYLQRTREELIGRVVWQEFPTLVGTPLEREYRRAMTDQVSVSLDHRASTTGRSFETHVYPSPDGLSVHFRDVTDARARDDQIQLHARVLEHMTEGVSLADESGVIVWTNPAEDRMFGYAPGELVGRHVSEQNAYPPEENARIVAEVMDTVRRVGEWRGQWHNRRKDGSTFFTEATITSVSRGDRLLWVCVQRDVTEQRQVADERQRLLEVERAARAEAERVGRMKDEFLATLSHELRTPLSAILGWAQILARRSDLSGDEVRRGVVTIHRNARAQSQIIDDLLDMHRIVSGKVRLEVQRVGLAGIVEAALDVVGPMADSKGVRLTWSMEREAAVAHVDPARLQQILWNLLTNAIKFTPAGGCVTVTLARRGEAITLTVADTGEGIAPGFLPHVFERFQQADASFSRRHAGLGLGLSIVRSLVELHGGTVSAKSAGAGCGATFTVVLPQRARPEEAARQGRSSPDTATAGTAARDQSLPGLSVLIVDDDEATRDLLTMLLTRSEAAVTAVESGVRALELMREQPGRFDVLVSDIAIPDMDGYELVRRVRALPPEGGGRIPAVALTAFARAEDGARAIEAGYQVHVRKPFEAGEILQTIATLAGTRDGLER